MQRVQNYTVITFLHHHFSAICFIFISLLHTPKHTRKHSNSSCVSHDPFSQICFSKRQNQRFAKVLCTYKWSINVSLETKVSLNGENQRPNRLQKWPLNLHSSHVWFASQTTAVERSATQNLQDTLKSLCHIYMSFTILTTWTYGGG